MIKHNQDGAVSGVMISLVMSILLLIGAIGFASWAFTSRQDFKNNTDQKVEAAVEVAKQQESARKDGLFAEEAKKPLKIYAGPDAYGGLQISYPKTWSGYVDASGTGSALVDGYFSPGVVPAINNPNSAFALRVQVLNQPYDQVVKSFSSQQKSGKITVSAYALPKLPKIIGVTVSGEITDKKTVTMVVVPLRSQTVKIWTEGTEYTEDFNKNILPNFSFSP